MTLLRYTEDHEWIRLEADGTATIGITDHAQDALGDIVFVELPATGKTAAKGEPICVVESVKAAADVKLPVAGTVVAVNAALPDDPSKINSDPLGEGWFIRIKPQDPAEIDALLDETAYRALTGS
ncbi:MAG: glycine cleavage system protein GcvH [Burkholderiaceae bacterium]|jgi:glycine cleavage system H protein